MTTSSTPKQAQVQGLPLNWTQMGGDAAPPITYPSDTTDLDPNETELVLVGTAGRKITHLGQDLVPLTKLVQLVLRSHVIRSMEGIQGLKNLELLELYDNQVEALTGLEHKLRLKTLDMSYNVIREMGPVQSCVHLTELCTCLEAAVFSVLIPGAHPTRSDLANNKLKTIDGLHTLKNLKKIDLGANRIRVLEGLEHCTQLEELWMGKNKIEEIQGLDKLTKLRRLDLQSNRLTKIQGLEAQKETLEELFLAHNGITDEGAVLPQFTQLSILDLSRNQLTSGRPFVHLTTLDELWISGNQIPSLEDVECLSVLELDTIYLEYNPLQQDPLYRKRLHELLPTLTQIDADMIQRTVHTPALPVQTQEQELQALQEQVIQRAKAESQK